MKQKKQNRTYVICSSTPWLNWQNRAPALALPPILSRELTNSLLVSSPLPFFIFFWVVSFIVRDIDKLILHLTSSPTVNSPLIDLLVMAMTTVQDVVDPHFVNTQGFWRRGKGVTSASTTSSSSSTGMPTDRTPPRQGNAPPHALEALRGRVWPCRATRLGPRQRNDLRATPKGAGDGF